MPDNYFSYFSDIEEHFCGRRGTHLTLSPLDWALMETWKDAGIPLEAVFRGIDSTFDKWERRRSRTRKVNALAFCAQEVLASAEEMKNAAVGADSGTRSEPLLESERVREFLARNAAQLRSTKLDGAARTVAEECSATLSGLADSVAAGASAGNEDLERHLTVMEQRLFGALLAATPDDVLLKVRVEADRELAPYRSRMTAPQIEQLHKQYVHKRVLEQYGLPRLSLFYM